MKGYLLAVSGAVILSALLACILPEGKMGKFIKGMVRLFVFSVILAPLLSLFTKGESFEFASSKIGEDEGYLSFCARLLEEEDERRIATLVLDEFEELSLQIEVEREAAGGFSLQKICVNIFSDGITEEEAHINILTRIKELIKNEYGFKAEVVWREGE